MSNYFSLCDDRGPSSKRKRWYVFVLTCSHCKYPEKLSKQVTKKEAYKLLHKKYICTNCE